MKKTLSVLCAVSALTASALTGCADGQTFTAKTYTYGSDTVASISVNVRDRFVELRPSTDGNVHIDCYESEKEYCKVTNTGGALVVEYAADREWTDFIGTKPPAEYRKLTVSLPSGISDIFASTTNENITVDRLSVSGGMTLSTNGGDILLDRADVGARIELNAKNGDISGSVVGDWNTFAITCKIKKGDCNLPESKPDGDKTLVANCNNGDIKISFAAGDIL